MDALCQLSYSPEFREANDSAHGGVSHPLGKLVYRPAFGADGRVDLVYLDGLRTVRVQCKTARRAGSVIAFATCSNTANRPRCYDGEVDEFGVYSPDTGLTYLVPFEAVPTRLCSLRLSPTRNGQAAGIRWARDYELGPP
jgi:hypothetical protein